MKHYFFLSHASFLTHLLDLSSTELRKSAKSASIVKLQSLLDLALNTDASGIGENDIFRFRDDVKVTMAASGLYDWLIEVASVSGMSAEDGMEMDYHMQEEQAKGKDKEEKKPILGVCDRRHASLQTNLIFLSHRCNDIGLQRQVPFVPSHLSQDRPTIPAHLPIPVEP